VKEDRIPFGLTARLLAVLIAFGAVPLALSITVGYRVSRSLLVGQAANALGELARGQAVQVSKELRRERLLLQTIASRLASTGKIAGPPEEFLPWLLVDNLPEAGIFDGLRVVAADGRLLTAIPLRSDPPRWPDAAPAADWSTRLVAIHRNEENLVVAYLLAAPLPGVSGGAWLEGHVRAADVAALFAIPEHMMGGGESAVYDDQGRAQ
jgi:hypothetical protein